MRHVVVTRFSVPRLDAATAGRHADPAWLDTRLAHFRRYYVPSLARLGVPAVLLCSSASAPYVGDRLADLPWVSLAVQDSWYGGWSGAPDQLVTRLDSDDALHESWFEHVEAAAGGGGAAGAAAASAVGDTAPATATVEVFVTRTVLRLDIRRGRLYAITRREPSPLAAFAGGANPFARDHKHLDRHHRVHALAEPYLLQVVHGGNLSSRAPAWWRFRRPLPLARLAPFGLDPAALVSTP